MRKFMISCALFAVPIMILIVSFIAIDPFKTIKQYDNYYVVGTNRGGLNRSFVSTMTYIQQFERYHYNSFIFGNSRSLAYSTDEWSKYLDSNAACFHFDESWGSIEGLYYKLKFIDKHGEHIKNAMFIVDHILLSNLNQTGSLFLMPPALIDNSNYASFQIEHFKVWANPLFLYHYIKFATTHIWTEEMGYYIENGKNYAYYNLKTNELNRYYEDSLINIGKYYTEAQKAVFDGVQNPSTSDQILADSAKINRLISMSVILKKHHTNFKIIISPLYYQIKINPDDYQLLCDIFGNENVYDFSGVNQWTSDYHNYYEESHYRPCVASEIMKIVYGDQ